MKTRIKRNLKPCSKTLQVFLATAFLWLSAFAALADDKVTPTPGVVSPTAKVFGKTYADWSAAWWQWCFSLPNTAHPLFDTADCSAVQSGPVWFLGGTFAIGGTETRNCAIPRGTYLFFPIINNWADNTGCSDSGCPPTSHPVAELRAIVKGSQDQAANLSFTVDGIPVQGLSDPIHTPYRVKSPAFTYALPNDPNNLLNWLLVGFCGSPSPGCFASGGSVFPAVADGVFVMVTPLAVGNHVIHFHGEIPAFGFTQDFTYNITVQ